MRYAAGVLFAIGVGCAGSAASQSPGDLQQRLDRLIPGLLAERQVPGVAIAVIRHGRLIWEGGYGLADSSSRTTVTPTILFNLGSVSKVAAAWGVMTLVDRGLIELDAPVERSLTRWRFPPSALGSAGITIRRLLTHTSGLSVLPASESFSYPRTMVKTLSQSYGSFGQLRPVQPPGTSFEYNNGNYVLLQLLVEEVTGTSFPAYLRKAVLAPLGMSGSGYDPNRRRLAVPYGGDPGPSPLERNPNFAASGGLYASAGDLGRLVAAAMRGPGGEPPGRDVLRPETVALMVTAAPETRGQYGIGYKMLPVSDSLTLIGHDGSNPGWQAGFLAAPARGVGLVILTNSGSGGRIIADVICTWDDWEPALALTGLCDGPRPIPSRRPPG